MINLNKGQVIDLTKAEDGGKITSIRVGLGWSGKRGQNIDLDSYIGVKTSNDSQKELVYFSNKTGVNGIFHNGDDLTGGGRAKDPNELIDIVFADLDDIVTTLDIGLFVFSGGVSFSDIKDAFINIVDQDGKELCRYDIVDFGGCKSLVAGTMKKSNGVWKLKASGIAAQDSCSEVRSKYTGSRVSTTRNSRSSRPAAPPRRQSFFGRLFS